MTEDDLIGEHLDEYRLDTLLGQGGMARVYRAFDVRLERYVAIKVIDAPRRTDAEYVKRFEREARAIAKLEHPHIVRLYRYGEVEGLLYMAMQYVNGVDLYYLMNSYRQDGMLIEPEDARRIIRETCTALDYAHQTGVIHRDVKPSNIMLDRQGQVLITDFGLALLVDLGTRGEIFGTPHYVAPEQAISSAGALPQSDLYSVGVILFEMFTGELPFDAAEPLDISMKHIGEAPPLPSLLRPEISPPLEAVILKALSKQPADRYMSGAELAQALDEALMETQRHRPLGVSPVPEATIPQRVEAGLEPLPPLPAPLAPAPLPAHAADRTFLAPARRPARRRWVPYALVASALAILCILAVIVVALWTGRGAQGTVGLGIHASATELAAPSPTQLVVASVQAGDSGLPGVLLLPTAATAVAPTLPSAPTMTASPLPPTVMPQVYALLFAKRGDDSLLVANFSPGPFPLAPLRIGDGSGALAGLAWGLDNLQPGACVVALKVGGKPKVPDVPCEEVGPRLKRSGSERFWKSTFAIYYGDVQVATCPENARQCEVSITSP